MRLYLKTYAKISCRTCGSPIKMGSGLHINNGSYHFHVACALNHRIFTPKIFKKAIKEAIKKAEIRKERLELSEYSHQLKCEKLGQDVHNLYIILENLPTYPQLIQ